MTGNPARRSVELVLAAALLAVAAAVFAGSAGFPSESAFYPRALAIMLGIGALAIGARELRWQPGEDRPRFFDHPRRFLLGLAFLVAYIVAVDGLGYILPSFVFGVGLPWVLGYRRLRLAVPLVVGTIALILLIFRVTLERPLPPDLILRLVGTLS